MQSIFKTALIAVGALVLSTVMASAVTLTFSKGDGNGSGTDLGAIGAFNYSFAFSSNNDRHMDRSSIWSGTTGATENLIVTGDWQFSTNDKRSASEDPLGYFIGAVYTALSYPKRAPAFENGSFSFLVPPNTTFGWVLASVDGRKGRSNATIFANITPAAVPLPAGGLMLVGAIGGLAALRRRKASTAV